MSDMNDYGGENGGSKGPGTNEVFIQDMTFTPGTIAVAANTTIKWVRLGNNKLPELYNWADC